MKKKYSDECLFCAKYLHDNGVVSENLDEMMKLAMDLDVDFNLVKVEKQAPKSTKEKRDEFFLDVAENLRLIWPPGKKRGERGEWDWRMDKFNLARRLKALWQAKDLSYDITKDEILQCAREYVAKFKDDTTYMVLLKYFVYKMKTEPKNVNGDSKILIQSSPLYDMLTEKKETRQVEEEWDNIFNQASVGEGELI